MAPSLVESETSAQSIPLRAPPPVEQTLKDDAGFNKEQSIGYAEKFRLQDELKGTAKQPPASFPHYLPVWDNETGRYPPLEPFEHYDHGKDADPSFPDLLPKGKAVVDDLTPSIGAEVRGVQLSQLSKEGKDQLALFVAQRKVVAFRDQDFARLPIDKALEWGSYFGRHHIHQTSGAPKGFPEIHLVHRGADDRSSAEFLSTHTNSVTWHSDVAFEKQPPGTTFLYLLDGPTSGGDTLFANTALAYRRLSPEFRKRLHGLKAVHSGIEQVNNSLKRGGIARRVPITSEHPIVRTHPVCLHASPRSYLHSRDP
ncbi:hypothetical protein MAP00_008385 [Monascus purpureus]|nr:hypothetical protein MAP00_008385 [Monascus purpureus]